MSGTSWILDKSRIATKIKSASGSCALHQSWKSNPTKACPKCQHVIDNSDVAQQWPGLPRGVKFDPTDQEIIWHLLTKLGVGKTQPHPFLDEFVPTVEKEDGICYTHPQNLPGVRQDGTVSHFFHRAIKAYNTGTRKRRKIQGDDYGDVRWHKTGRTKPVFLEGTQQGCKKIMVLYVTPARGGKSEKTNWVMHQYHLGTEEDERDGEYVISKIFYQQQVKPGDKSEHDILTAVNVMTPNVDPRTPSSVTPDPHCPERRTSDSDHMDAAIACTDLFDQMEHAEEEVQSDIYLLNNDYQLELVNLDHQIVDNNNNIVAEEELLGNLDHRVVDNNDHNAAEEEPKWWDGESQHLLDSQQLVEGISLCDELLQSQSPNRNENEHENENENENGRVSNGRPRLADYRELGAEYLKKDLEECQNLCLDPSNLETDTPPEFRLSQLDFNSQDSYLAWGGGKALGS